LNSNEAEFYDLLSTADRHTFFGKCEENKKKPFSQAQTEAATNTFLLA
jgi:hypothetical protein